MSSAGIKPIFLCTLLFLEPANYKSRSTAVSLAKTLSLFSSTRYRSIWLVSSREEDCGGLKTVYTLYVTLLSVMSMVIPFLPSSFLHWLLYLQRILHSSGRGISRLQHNLIGILKFSLIISRWTWYFHVATNKVDLTVLVTYVEIMFTHLWLFISTYVQLEPPQIIAEHPSSRKLSMNGVLVQLLCTSTNQNWAYRCYKIHE